MIAHAALGTTRFARSRQLCLMIQSGAIRFAGNQKLHIFGHLHCRTGRRMKLENRVFFKDDDGAIASGYRPCGHCMRVAYKNWKVENS